MLLMTDNTTYGGFGPRRDQIGQRFQQDSYAKLIDKTEDSVDCEGPLSLIVETLHAHIQNEVNKLDGADDQLAMPIVHDTIESEDVEQANGTHVPIEEVTSDPTTQQYDEVQSTDSDTPTPTLVSGGDRQHDTPLEEHRTDSVTPPIQYINLETT